MPGTLSLRNFDRDLEESITQQQRNNRRRRATVAQVRYLRQEFERNPRPDKETQFAIGRHIDMTRRSVQIWFQNNRAKLRNVRRTASNHCHGSMGSTPLSAHRSYSQPQLTHPLRRPFYQNDFISSVSVNESPALYRLRGCDCLAIGNWCRTKPSNTSTSDLLVEISSGCLKYSVLFNGIWFQAETSLKSITDATLYPDNQDHSRAHISIRVERSPRFARKRDEAGSRWEPCEDFTQGAAVHAQEHWLSGPSHRIAKDLDMLNYLRPGTLDDHESAIADDEFYEYGAGVRSTEDFAKLLADDSSDLIETRPGLERSISTQSSSEICSLESSPVVPEFRMSRQMSMPTLLPSNATDYEDSKDRTSHTPPTCIVSPELYPPRSNFVLSLPPSKHISPCSSPTPDFKDEFNLFQLLPPHPSRTSSPSLAENLCKQSPSLFSDSDFFSPVGSSTPLTDSLLSRSADRDFGYFKHV